MALGINFNPKRFHKSQIKFFIPLIIVCIFMGLPIVYIFSTALKPTDELFVFPPRFFVQNPTIVNFKKLFSVTGTGIPITTFLINSIITTFLVVFCSVLFSAMAGYILSKKHFKGKNTLFEINKTALMFVPITVMIPRFLVISNIGIVDTRFAHVLPLLAIPVGLFLIKQFVDQVPNELIEAAQIDGAGDFYIFLKIVIPLIKPALATVAILAFQSAWNNTETSMLFVSTETKQTFAFYMSSILNVSNTVAGTGISAAATLIMFLPNLTIFIFLQNKVMSTMAHSGIK
ncbi:MAG: transporter permease [Haloplasmataceae bacterium]|jgi:multiple sugar transport system permease protein|nr:transporter permease [Haloplasmataceae bacterium]